MASGNQTSSDTIRNVPKGEMVEAIVCQTSDIKENEMKVFEIGREGDQVLVVKQQGKIYALGNKCTHYGAPLVNGALGKGRVRCPWHGACFNIANGDIEDFPGLDGVPSYQCEIVAGGGVKVKAYKSMLKDNRRHRINHMATKDPKVNSTFVIIGAGAAGNNCAETLRQIGYQGRIVMISAEKHLPYDRIKVSKVLNVDPEGISLRKKEFYKEADIELMLNTKATKIKTDDHMVLLSDGTHLEYTKVFIATGSRGRLFKLPGSNLENIFTVRNIEDGINIYNKLGKDKDVVIVGSSFIGMEVASFCIEKVKSITVVSKSSIPFENSLGKMIGQRIFDLFTSKGVNFIMNTTVEKYISNDDKKVSKVVLSGDKSIPADIVVVGLGVDHNTEFLAGSEVTMRMDGSIPVNKNLETNVKGVFAGGDIAYAPVFANNDKPNSIGHWQLAHYHGYIAAFNMFGKVRPIQSVPFFWTVLQGRSIRYAGVGGNYDTVVISGSLEEFKFSAYYCEGDKVNAIATCGADPLAAKYAELLANGKRLKKSDVSKSKLTWAENLTF